MTKPKSLDDIRLQIDQLNQQLVELISQRAQLSLTVADIKKQQGDDAVFYRPEREAQILRELIKKNPGPLSDQNLAMIFRDIMSGSLALQSPRRVAFLGPKGTFSHAAVLKHFGPAVTLCPTLEIAHTFQQVEKKQAHYAIVPFENSTEGMVNATLDAFKNSKVQICGEITLAIHHHLLVSDKASTIKRIYSHPQSLAQCKQWLMINMPNIECIASSSNAQAATLAQQEPHSAAIASELAATEYSLDKIAENIEDNPENVTRFLIIGQQDVAPSGNDKTFLRIHIANNPGALFHIVRPFAKHNVNIALLESRPSHRHLWNYIFFLEIDGHQQEPAVRKALAALQKEQLILHILGSYPKAVL